MVQCLLSARKGLDLVTRERDWGREGGMRDGWREGKREREETEVK